MAKTVTVAGSTQVDTDQKKFGSGSGLFNNIAGQTGADYLLLDSEADMSFGVGAFTIDFWVRPSALTNAYNNVMDNRGSSPGNNVNSFCIALTSAGGAGNKGWLYGLGLGVCEINTIYAVNNWYHIAIVGNGGSDGSRTVKVYINGSLASGVSVTANYNINKDLIKLGNAYDNNGLIGWMDEIRVSKGVERWVADFTPPASAYDCDSNTKLLLHCDGEDASQVFLDDDIIPSAAVGNMFLAF